MLLFNQSEDLVALPACQSPCVSVFADNRFSGIWADYTTKADKLDELKNEILSRFHHDFLSSEDPRRYYEQRW